MSAAARSCACPSLDAYDCAQRRYGSGEDSQEEQDPCNCACHEDGEDLDDDSAGRCYWCGGEGWDECDDPIQCTNEHRNGLCRCASCGGSGLAKDMTIW